MCCAIIGSISDVESVTEECDIAVISTSMY